MAPLKSNIISKILTAPLFAALLCTLPSSDIHAQVIPEKVPYSLDLAWGGELIPIDATPDEFRAALAGLIAGGESEEAALAFEGLAATSPIEREKASRKLLKILATEPASAMPLIRSGLESDDPEVRMRCQALLKNWTPPNIDGLLERALARRTPGLLPLFEKASESFWMGRRGERLPDIVEGIARKDDLGVTRGWVKHDLSAFRIAAVRVLAKFGTPDELAELADDPDAHVRLEVALRWGFGSDRRCVPLFKKLVSSDEFLVRSVAACALENLSGEFFGFPGTLTEEIRTPIEKKWSEFDLKDPNFPLRLPRSVLSNAPVGDHLFVLREKGPAGKYDSGGNLVKKWDVPFSDQASDLIPLDGGKILLGGATVGDEFSWKLIGADSEILRGGVRASYPCPSYLSDGCILLCERDKITEIGPDDGGKDLELDLLGNIGRNAFRTRYGTTLVATSQDVMEFDRRGQWVWSTAIGGDSVVCCQGLPNGNVLIVYRISNKVVEVTHLGEPVWEWKSPKGRLQDCFLLPSGNLLVSTDRGALEVGRDGRVFWEIPDPTIWQVRRGE